MQPTKSTFTSPPYQLESGRGRGNPTSAVQFVQLEGGRGRGHPAPTQVVFAQLVPQSGQQVNLLQRRLQSATWASHQASSSLITDVSVLKDLQMEKIASLQRVCKSDDKEISSNTLLSLRSFQQELTSIIRNRISKKKETIPYLKDEMTNQLEQGIFEYRISWKNFCFIRRRFNIMITRIEMNSPSQSDLQLSQSYRTFLTRMEEALTCLNPNLEMNYAALYETAELGGFNRYNLDLSKIEEIIQGIIFQEESTNFIIGEIKSVIVRGKSQAQEKTFNAKLEEILSRILKLENHYGQSGVGPLTLDVLTLQLQLSERLGTLIVERYNSLFATSPSSVSLSTASIPVSSTESSSVSLSMASIPSSSLASSSVSLSTASIPVSNTSASSSSLSPELSNYALYQQMYPYYPAWQDQMMYDHLLYQLQDFTPPIPPISSATGSTNTSSETSSSLSAISQPVKRKKRKKRSSSISAGTSSSMTRLSPSNASISSSLSSLGSHLPPTTMSSNSSIGNPFSQSFSPVPLSISATTSSSSSIGSPLPLSLSPVPQSLSPLPLSLSPVPLSISATTSSSSSIGSPLPLSLSPVPLSLSPAPLSLSPAPLSLSPLPLSLSPVPLSLSPLPLSLSPVPLSISATTNSSSSIGGPLPSTTTNLTSPLSSVDQLTAQSQPPIHAPVTSSSNQNPPPPTLTEAHFGSWLYNDQSDLGRHMRRSQSVPTFINFFNDDFDENSIVREVTDRKGDTFDSNDDIN